MADEEQVRKGPGDAVPSLADLVAPLDACTFLDDYWNRGFRAWPGRSERFAGLPARISW